MMRQLRENSTKSGRACASTRKNTVKGRMYMKEMVTITAATEVARKKKRLPEAQQERLTIKGRNLACQKKTKKEEDERDSQNITCK